MSQDPRQETWKLAQSDLDAAWAFAEKIEWDWYRVQSLAAVAWHTQDKAKFAKVVNSALEISRGMSEPNRAVSSAAWVVRTMVQRNDVDAMPIVKELLSIIDREPNKVRQADALLLLFEAVYRKPELRESVFAELIKACEQMYSWKQPRILTDLALILAVDDLNSAEKVIEMIPKDSDKHKAKKFIEAGKYLGPHEFLPYYAKVVNT